MSDIVKDVMAEKIILEHIKEAHKVASARLLSEFNDSGFCEGHLSASALSATLAVFALSRFYACQESGDAKNEVILSGLKWLLQNQNNDGGWADTDRSPSNFSTTILCRATIGSQVKDFQSISDNMEKACGKADAYLSKEAKGNSWEDFSRHVLEIYGGDRTFSAPILTMCSLSGVWGEKSWDMVPQLPFELSLLPRKLYRFLRLDVVSYALPALIAIGIVRNRSGRIKHGQRDNQGARKDSDFSWRLGDLAAYFSLRGLRRICERPALRILEKIQPESGGFIEAIPLTAFVLMSLCASGEGESRVACRCAEFLEASFRSDGSWAIDSNLSCWLTSLSVAALGWEKESAAKSPRCQGGSDGDKEKVVSSSENDKCIFSQKTLDWLLSVQTKDVHPFTSAAPGGWAWTDLPGGVPDADDTSAALAALYHYYGLFGSEKDEEILRAAASGLTWLIDLQNSDGGIPTFCRGWGKLPFDCSCPDITAHYIIAQTCWLPFVGGSLKSRGEKALSKALRYLVSSQLDNGSWNPLWFGSTYHKDHHNPVYGTSEVLFALSCVAEGTNDNLEKTIEKAANFLKSCQNSNGAFACAADADISIEETALAVRALYECGEVEPALRGAEWLCRATNGGKDFMASPIGLYFSSLWYYEKLYPLIFTVSALGRF